jgi:hypothetical protein
LLEAIAAELSKTRRPRPDGVSKTNTVNRLAKDNPGRPNQEEQAHPDRAAADRFGRSQHCLPIMAVVLILRRLSSAC